MNSYQKRIVAAAIVGIAIVTAVYVPIQKDMVVHTAYGSLLLAIILSGVSLWQLTKTSAQDYITSVAFPLVLQGYLGLTIFLAVLFVALDLAGVWSIPYLWYIALQLVITGMTALKVLTIGAAQEAIQQVGGQVHALTSNWKLLQADVEAILQSAPSEMRKELTEVRDAIRYADPMSRPEVAAQEQELVMGIGQLKELVKANKADEAKTVCTTLQNVIKDRANRLKALK